MPKWAINHHCVITCQFLISEDALSPEIFNPKTATSLFWEPGTGFSRSETIMSRMSSVDDKETPLQSTLPEL
ncbi:hypothetical protein AWENTII_006547 [Aspergillus wentii]